MWARLRMKGIIVKRARVMTLLRELDPDGIESRRKKRLRRRAYHAKGGSIIGGRSVSSSDRDRRYSRSSIITDFFKLIEKFP